MSKLKHHWLMSATVIILLVVILFNQEKEITPSIQNASPVTMSPSSSTTSIPTTTTSTTTTLSSTYQEQQYVSALSQYLLTEPTTDGQRWLEWSLMNSPVVLQSVIDVGHAWCSNPVSVEQFLNELVANYEQNDAYDETDWSIFGLGIILTANDHLCGRSA